jgi:hypothetical protein
MSGKLDPKTLRGSSGRNSDVFDRVCRIRKASLDRSRRRTQPIEAGLGVRPTSTTRAKVAYGLVREATSSLRLIDQQPESSVDPESAGGTLDAEQISRLYVADHNIAVAPICSKCSVACYLFWERYRDVQLKSLPVSYLPRRFSAGVERPISSPCQMQRRWQR